MDSADAPDPMRDNSSALAFGLLSSLSGRALGEPESSTQVCQPVPLAVPSAGHHHALAPTVHKIEMHSAAYRRERGFYLVPA